MKRLKDYNLKDQKALIRVDFNVPLDESFNVTDATRIVSAKPTIIQILEAGGSCVLMSHLGRPDGIEDKYSLKHIVNKVSEIIGVEVLFVSDCVGELAEQAVNDLKPGQVLVFSPFLIHGFGYNFSKKKTRSALEFRPMVS